MKRLLHWFRPTLVRRIILATVFAFGLVWIALIVFIYLQTTGPKRIDGDVHGRGENILAIVSTMNDANTARDVVSDYSKRTNDNRRKFNTPGAVLMQLSDRPGNRLFLSPEAQDKTLTGDIRQVTEAVVNGKDYWIFKGESTRWSLIVAVPKLEVSWAVMKINEQLIVDLLIAFPLVLLPILIAISSGLRPLNHLSNRIASRGPDDLSPLGIDPKYGELKPLTSALDDLLTQLRTKVARENTFVQDAAHELRTPMAVISAQAHVLVKASGEDQRAEAGQRLEHAIARASHLIQQLLELAHIDSNRVADICALDVAQLVRQELASIAPAAMARKLDLSLNAPDALFHPLDVHAFQSILQNLLTNALRYVHDGSQVVVTLSKQHDILTLSVADNGPGIPEPERVMIFERFYRGIGHDVSGSGLGLSIVKQAVARLHGTVRLAIGLDGKGCEFIVEIPA